MRYLPLRVSRALGALAVLVSTSANAAFMTFNDNTAFNVAISGAAAIGTDGFDGLTGNAPLGNTLNRTAGALKYQAFDPVGLDGLKAGLDADGFMTNQDRTSAITLRTFDTGVNAFGANFFGSDLQGVPILCPPTCDLESVHVYVEESDGDWFDIILTKANRATFFGYVGDSELARVQFWTCESVTACTLLSPWPSIDNLTLAKDAAVPNPVPEPMPLLLAGPALMGVLVTRRRRRSQAE